MQQPRLPSRNHTQFDMRKLAYFLLIFLILNKCPLPSIATANNLNKLRGMDQKHQIENRQHKMLSPFSSSRRLMHPLSCPDDTVLFQFHLITDKYGTDDTSISLFNENGAALFYMKVGQVKNNADYTWDKCLPKDMCYVFTIKDEHGDGICCDEGAGSYALLYDGVVIASGGDFGSMATHLIGCESWSPSAMPSLSLYPSLSPTLSSNPTMSLRPSSSPTLTEQRVEKERREREKERKAVLNFSRQQEVKIGMSTPDGQMRVGTTVYGLVFSAIRKVLLLPYDLMVLLVSYHQTLASCQSLKAFI
mmetsp:Transcript_27057/g.39213  ORF Transcript_27057/g.39213 Transcript_27057/m.39213 type:complete len:305 (-) Transcript_27057:195-1109(-)